jgi:hypothetical protein
MLAAARVVGALLILAAAVQGIDAAATVANFFSFFTVLSNLFAAAVLTGGAFRSPSSPGWERVRGAAVLYMVTTGIVYAVLLSGADEVGRYTPDYLNWVMHRVMPVYMAIDWLIDPPRHTLRTRDVLAWLVFPLAYCAYSLIRGAAIDWYPYPFLDADEHGYAAVLATSAGIAVVVFLLGLAIAWAGNQRSRGAGRRPAPAPA